MTVRVVPDFDARVEASKSSQYCVVVFVLNEGERLHRTLRRIMATGSGLDVIVADGGSRDGSTEPRQLASLGARVVLTKRGPGGLSAQMRMAFAYALDEGYQGIITIDGNDKDDPGALPLFVAALRDGIDHVQGSRFIPGGRAVNTPPLRYVGIRVVHAPLISLAARHRYTDTTNGFRAYSARFLSSPFVQPFRPIFDRYQLHYYLAIRATRGGFRVAEVPVTRAYPATGKTPTKISPVRGSTAVLVQLVEACMGRFDPQEDAR